MPESVNSFLAVKLDAFAMVKSSFGGDNGGDKTPQNHLPLRSLKIVGWGSKTSLTPLRVNDFACISRRLFIDQQTTNLGVRSSNLFGRATFACGRAI
jgi:hypothetical protein